MDEIVFVLFTRSLSYDAALLSTTFTHTTEDFVATCPWAPEL